MPVNPALRRLRQKDHLALEVSLGYIDQRVSKERKNGNGSGGGE